MFNCIIHNFFIIFTVIRYNNVIITSITITITTVTVTIITIIFHQEN